MDLTGFGYAGSCREYTSPRNDERSTPKGWIRGDTNIGPLEVKVTYHLYQYGIEINIDSMKNDGSQSWIVISRGMNKYVDDEDTGCEKTEGTIHSTIIFTLNDCYAVRSAEVERHFCR